MIKDLGLFSWRIGLVLIVAMPMLYVAGWIAPFVITDGANAVMQFILGATVLIPPIFLSIALGCVLCLLVRIEAHLRANRKDA